MKTIILLAAVALLAALAVAHSDTEQNDLLVRDARDADSRRKMKKGSKLKKNKKNRRKNKKKDRKTYRKNRKTSRKNKKKTRKNQAGKSSMRTIDMREEVCAPKTPTPFNRVRKAKNSLKQLRNMENLINITLKKKSKVEFANSNTSLLFTDAIKALGDLTNKGRRCGRECDQTVYDNYKKLVECRVDSLRDCTSPPYNGTSGSGNSTECKKELENIETICQDPTKKEECCKTDMSDECDYHKPFLYAKAAKTKCIKTFGGFFLC